MGIFMTGVNAQLWPQHEFFTKHPKYGEGDDEGGGICVKPRERGEEEGN